MALRGRAHVEVAQGEAVPAALTWNKSWSTRQPRWCKFDPLAAPPRPNFAAKWRLLMDRRVLLSTTFALLARPSCASVVSGSRLGSRSFRTTRSRQSCVSTEDSLIARIMDEGSGPGMTYGRGR